MRSFNLCLMVVATLVAAPGWADTIHLQDGSTVFGSITGVDGGNLLVQTEFAGEIGISLEAIKGIETEAETGFKLESGEVVSGRLQFDNGRQELLREDQAIEVAPTSILAIGDPAALTDPGPVIEWHGRAEFGLNLQFGNTDRLDVNTRISSTRETEIDRLILELRGQYAEENDSKSANEVLASATYEYDVNEKLFVFGETQFEYDEFEGLDLRVVVSGGAGYFFFDTDRSTLKGRVGLAYQHQDFEDGTVTDDVLLQLGYDYRLHVREWFQFTSVLDFFANATEVKDWRFDADNAVEVPISSTEAWKLRFGVRNEYDNEPQPGFKSLDTTVYSALIYDWL